ncbi:hypothetical protein Bp8pS_063 [Bacillus phage vB_BpuM-BpSp]|nr:hypothetical protein Bp8pS_063 [Bacillus phage vB_BpuM-BpSp]
MNLDKLSKEDIINKIKETLNERFPDSKYLNDIIFPAFKQYFIQALGYVSLESKYSNSLKVILSYLLINKEIEDEALTLKKLLPSSFWDFISYQDNLPNGFIREYKDVLNFKILSLHHHLTCEFIIEYKDLINFNNIKTNLVTKQNKDKRIKTLLKLYDV